MGDRSVPGAAAASTVILSLGQLNVFFHIMRLEFKTKAMLSPVVSGRSLHLAFSASSGSWPSLVPWLLVSSL